MVVPRSTPPVVHEQPVPFPSRPSSSYSPSPPQPRNLGRWELAAQEFGVENYKSELQRRYGEVPYFNYKHVGCDEAQRAQDELAQARLYLMSDEQILAIPLKEIDDYRPSVIDVLRGRLEKMETKTRHPPRGSLGELHQKKLEPEAVKSLSQNVKGLLTSDQIAALIAHPLTDQEFISPLLPIDSHSDYTMLKYEVSFTRSRVAAISERLLPYIGKLDAKRIPLLPFEVFAEERFPWEQVQEIEVYSAREIFENISVEKVNRMAPRVTAEFLNYFPDHILQSPQLEWPVWLSEQGIGLSLLSVRSENFTDNFPYDQMADNPEEAKVLLKARHSGPTLFLYKLNNLTSILKLLPHLEVGDIRWIRAELLMEEQFPWQLFLEMAGIGAALKEVAIHKELSHFPEIIPWEFLNPEEAEELFPLLNGDEKDWEIEYKTGSYQKLTVRAIEKLFDVLTINHLPLLPKGLFQDKAFPWGDYLSCPGIGKFLRKMGDISNEAIPWDQLPPSEAQPLFFLGNKKGNEQLRTKRLLGQLKEPALKLLADKLTPDHVHLFPS